MIYLLDDNKYGQMSENYDIDYEEIITSDVKYKTIIKYHKEYKQPLEELFKDRVEGVLLHDSWEDSGGTHNQKNSIIDHCKDQKTPLVIFSNQFVRTIFEDENIIHIRKDRMYANLLPFLDNFKQDNKLDLNMLYLGVNYDVEKVKILYDDLSKIISSNTKKFRYKQAFGTDSEAYDKLTEFCEFTQEEGYFGRIDEDLERKDIDAKEMIKIITDTFSIIKTKLKF